MPRRCRAASGRSTRERRLFGGNVLTRIVGLCVFLGAWEAIGRSGLWGESFPALSTIAQAFGTEAQRNLLGRSLARTGSRLSTAPG